MPPKRTQSFLLFAIAFLAAGALPFAYALKYGPVAALTSFAGDTFYYLGVAQRSQHFHGFTFDGQYSTNGFHPLWEWLLSTLAWAGVLNFSRPLSVVLRVFQVNVLLLAFAAGTFCLTCSTLLKRRWLALGISSPGPIWLLVGLATPGLAATWSFVNGMESALSWCCFALAFAVYMRMGDYDTWLPLLFSVLLGLTVLARLDEIFLAASLLVTLFAMQRRLGRAGAARSIAFSTPFALMLGAYLLYNKAAVGAMLPLSGAVKAGISLNQNLHHIAWLLLPVFRGEPPAALGTGPASTFNETYVRLAQMLLPLLFATVEWLRTMQRTDRNSRLLRALYLGVILKALYNLCFVALYNQGAWYYAVSIAIANFIVVRWLDEAMQLLHPRPLSLTARWGASIGVVCAGLIAFNVFLTQVKVSSGPALFALIRDGQPMGNELRHQGYERILEFQDGAISYAFAMPAESAFGLALDAQATAAAKRGDFLRTMESRGVTLAVSQGAYSAAIAQYFREQRWKLGLPLFAIPAREFYGYTLVPIQHDPVHDLDYYRIKRLP